MQTWAAKNGVDLRFIQPGKPVQNAYIESFSSRFRDECLSQHWFASLSRMRNVVGNWRDDYNHHQAHSTLGYMPPALFAAQCRQLACRHCANQRINYDANLRHLDQSATNAGGSAVGLGISDSHEPSLQKAPPRGKCLP